MGELEEEIMRAWHAAMQVWEERHLYEPIKSAPEPEPWRPPATWRATVLGDAGGALSGEVQQYDPSTDRWRTVRLDMIYVTDNRKVF